MDRTSNLHILAATLLLALSSCFTGAKAERFIVDSVRIGGYMRHFKMILPDGLKDNAPLVFVLHGYGNKGKIDTWMNDAARRHGFAVCVPVGLVDPNGKNSWNVGYPHRQDGWKVDDVNTMCKMAATVQKRYRLSRDNTFLTGMSNGGEMCYLLAFSKQKTFKALASVAGLTLGWMMRDLKAPRPIPFMEIHGTEDRTSEWTGDLPDKGGWGPYLSVPIAVGYWVAQAQCNEELTERVESIDPASKNYIIKHRFVGGRDNIEVWLYEVVGGKHCWHTKDIDTGEEVWKFFSKYLTH